MGFGHRVYKNYDPRARIIRQIAEEVFEILGREPLIEVAAALEKVALADPFFVKRKLYPNVDFYSGLIYVRDMHVVLFILIARKEAYSTMKIILIMEYNCAVLKLQREN